MKVIQVRYLEPDNTRGSRFVASTGWAGPVKRATIGTNYSLGYDDNVIAAARALVAKIWDTNPPEVVPDVGMTRAGFEVVALKFPDD